MSYTPQQLSEVFHKVGGRCHVCGKTLVFNKYGHFGRLGEWEIDHVIPISKGGAASLDNVAPACISCNRRKPANSRSFHTSSLA